MVAAATGNAFEFQSSSTGNGPAKVPCHGNLEESRESMSTALTDSALKKGCMRARAASRNGLTSALLSRKR